jgi:hypothetical protein
VLERVKIMRVFDLEGVVEAVEEVKEGLEGSTEEGLTSSEEKKRSEEEEAGDQEKKPVSIPRNTVIPDSEDEDDEEDEMLLETPVITTDAVSPQKGQTEDEHISPPERKGETAIEEKVSFILIDNLAHVLNPLLKEDYVKGKHTPASPPLVARLNRLQQQHNPHPSSAPSQP